MGLSVAGVAERFRDFRRRRFFKKNWGPLEPFFGRRGEQTAAAVARCRANAGTNVKAADLVTILERLGPRQRKELPQATKRLSASTRTKKLYERAAADMFLVVCDVAVLEYVYHERNRARGQRFGTLAPNMRNLFLELLVVRITITLSRLLDPAESGGQRTGSIEALAESLKVDGFVRLSAEFKKILGKRERSATKNQPARRATGVRRVARRLTRTRNKDLAHSDEAAILDLRKRPSVTLAGVNKTIAGLASILNRYASVIRNVHRDHAHVAGAATPGRELLDVLALVPMTHDGTE